jgi:hypothetical protein
VGLMAMEMKDTIRIFGRQNKMKEKLYRGLNDLGRGNS